MGYPYKNPSALRAMLLCAALTACQADSGGQACQMVHVTDLPIVVHDRAFYTTISINGKAASLQFDTGAEDNLLTETAAQRMGLRVLHGADNEINGIGGSREAGTVHSREVQLGEAHGTDVHFSTVPADAYNESDGLLGMNFLYYFDLDLDFWHRRIGLYKPLAGCHAPRVAMGGKLYGADLVQTLYDERGRPNDLSPAVMVTINGRHLRAVIDTGAAHSLIFRDTARRAGLSQAEVLATFKERGLGPREVKSDLRISAPVEIGDLTIRNMPILVIDQRHDETADMLLGFDFVTLVHVWVSRSSGTLVMQYPPEEN